MSAACQSLPVLAYRSLTGTATAVKWSSPRVRHPHGFYLVCIAVFFERWAAAMLSSSVVLMLCERYSYGRSDALRLAGLFNAVSYLATLPGGIVVDRVLGPRRALGAGMMLLALGYAVLTQVMSVAILISVGSLVLGHALFKPSTQAALARLYGPNDRRLDAAQVAFYLVVNSGSIVGALVAGLLMRVQDWRIQFAVAALAILAGRILIALGRDLLRLRPMEQAVAATKAAVPGASSPSQRARVIGLLTLAMMLYTVGFGQVEGSLLLWAQDRTDRVLYGFEVPAAWFVGLPAFLVLILAPMQLALLPWIQRRIDTGHLVAWGLVAILLAFAVLVPPALWNNGHRVSMAWLMACMSLLVIGELLIAPLGLSMILRLAPPRFVGIIVGAWYVAGALGYWLAGELGAMWLRCTAG